MRHSPRASTQWLLRSIGNKLAKTMTSAEVVREKAPELLTLEERRWRKFDQILNPHKWLLMQYNANGGLLESNTLLKTAKEMREKREMNNKKEEQLLLFNDNSQVQEEEEEKSLKIKNKSPDINLELNESSDDSLTKKQLIRILTVPEEDLIKEEIEIRKIILKFDDKPKFQIDSSDLCSTARLKDPFDRTEEEREFIKLDSVLNGGFYDGKKILREEGKAMFNKQQLISIRKTEKRLIVDPDEIRARYEKNY